MQRGQMTKPIIIIGAGIGGLSAAIHLAAAGQQVVVLEKNSLVGGKMYQHRADGFYWDTGPSIVTMRHVFEHLFESAGRALDDYIDLQPVEPLTRYFYQDGVVLDATRDLSRMATQIAALDEQDVEGYLRFLAYAARVHRIAGPVFIYDQPPTLGSFARVPPRDMAGLDMISTPHQLICRHVRSPHLRQMLARFATYVGANPYQAPAMLSVIAHVELTGGVWYPRGGIHQIAQGMARLAAELGVTIETDCAVEQIVVEEGRATGVMLANGARVDAQQVVANVDVATVYQHLLPPALTATRQRKRLFEAKMSCSGFVLLLGVEDDYAQLAQHNIFFSQDYRHEFDDIFTRHMPPQDPTIYIAITSKIDATHAPPGCENWFVLVNVPSTNSAFDWRNEAQNYRDHVLETLADAGLDVRQHIRSERILTPLDIAEMSGAWRGALYGISSNQPLNAFRRPHNRCPDIQGLYFAGGTTHPGGGVPMVTLSGKVAAGMVLSDQG